jgi:hypothetical protein
MDIKMFEIRDVGTLIPAIGIRLNPTDGGERWLLARAGFGQDVEGVDGQGSYVLLIFLTRDIAHYDPAQWGDRTMLQAHLFIRDKWFALRTGDVVDVQFVLGETDHPKTAERWDPSLLELAGKDMPRLERASASPAPRAGLSDDSIIPDLL